MCVCICIYICIYIYIYVCIYICTYICIYMYIYVYVYIYICVFGYDSSEYACPGMTLSTQIAESSNPPNRETQLPWYLVVQIQIEILVWFESVPRNWSVWIWQIRGCSIFSGIFHMHTWIYIWGYALCNYESRIIHMTYESRTINFQRNMSYAYLDIYAFLACIFKYAFWHAYSNESCVYGDVFYTCMILRCVTCMKMKIICLCHCLVHSVLQCVAACCSTVCCSVLQCVESFVACVCVIVSYTQTMTHRQCVIVSYTDCCLVHTCRSAKCQWHRQWHRHCDTDIVSYTFRTHIARHMHCRCNCRSAKCQWHRQWHRHCDTDSTLSRTHSIWQCDSPIVWQCVWDNVCTMSAQTFVWDNVYETMIMCMRQW